MKNALKDITGQIFGKLTVLSFSHTNKHAYWNCLCECGNSFIACGSYMRSGWTNSCGCIVGKHTYKHGASGKNRTKEYIAWGNIIDRCYNPLNKNYKHYGGRGITVCDRWRNSYELFLVDMGSAPTKKHSVEREKVNGNYEPSNCKWATQKEQANNRTNNIIILYNGQQDTLTNWCSKLGLNYFRVHSLIKNQNKTLDDIVEMNLGQRCYRVLNKLEVIVLKTFLNEGIHYKTIARTFGISENLIWRIGAGKSFKNIAA